MGAEAANPPLGIFRLSSLLPDGEEDHQEPHDPSVLPHLYGKRDRDLLLPVIHAPPRGPNNDDWSPELSS